jgi:tellurite resistance protein TehA-like permease
MTIARDGPGRSLGRAAAAIKNLDPGYFAFVMATSIISTGTFLLGPSWLSRALLAIASVGLAVLIVALVIRLVLFRPSVAADFHDPGRVFGFGFWRYVRHHWPLSYDPALWSMVFPLGMYSVATLTFGKVAHLAFMEPLSRFMLWVALAAWVAVAAAFVEARITRAWPTGTPPRRGGVRSGWPLTVRS